MSGGIAAAAAEALAKLEAGQGEGQPALFDDLDVAEIGNAEAASPLTGALPRKAGVGRPKGSRNRRTEATAAWLLSLARHPVQVMMETYSMSPAALADQLGIPKPCEVLTHKAADGSTRQEIVEAKEHSPATILELYKLQLRMAEAAAPYVAQKLPQAVSVDAKGALTVAFAGVSLPARGDLAGDFRVVGEEPMGLPLPSMSDDASRNDS